MNINRRQYSTIGGFFRHEFTNDPKNKQLHGITPLFIAMNDMRRQMKNEIYNKEWIQPDHGMKNAPNVSKVLQQKRLIMTVYFPLINTTMLFSQTTANDITVIPCEQRFESSENSYDPRDVYIHRILYSGTNKIPTIVAEVRYSYSFEEMFGDFNGEITYGYLLALYCDMVTSIINEIEEEYQICYMRYINHEAE